MTDCADYQINTFEDIDRRCRTCLRICAEFNDLAKCVEVGDNNILSLTEIILSCASVQISEQDGLPQRICETCKGTAIRSHLFKIQCEASNKCLQMINRKVFLNKHKTTSREKTDSNHIYLGPQETIKIRVVGNNEKASDDDDDDDDDYSKHSKQSSEEDEEIYGSIGDEEPDFQIQTNKKNNGEHSCCICQKTFPTEKKLLKHHKIHDVNNKHITPRTDPDSENVKRRTCSNCGKVFQFRTSMLKHQKKHNAPPKTCSYCNFQPTTPSILSKHMEQTHAHLKSFSCSLCDKTFFRKANLRLHAQVHTGVKKHTCEICGISFVLRGNLSVHRRLHTGERPYTCSVCGRGFTQQSALRSHEAGHSDRRDYVCPECGAAFSRAGAMRNHRKRHSAAKPFECSICGKKFTFSSERKRHMLIHSGDKNHECEVCGRRFSRNTNLKVHRRIHTGETPHVCDVCGKGFIQAHCLRTHMNTHVEATHE